MAAGLTGEVGAHALLRVVQEPIHVVERAPILLHREAAPRVRDPPHLAKLVRTWFAYVGVKKQEVNSYIPNSSVQDGFSV